MSHKLRLPFVADHPTKWPNIILVERIAVGPRGELIFQGRTRGLDGSRGQPVSFEPAADEVASYFQALAGKYGGYMVRHGEEFESEDLLWRTVKRRLAEENRR